MSSAVLSVYTNRATSKTNDMKVDAEFVFICVKYGLTEPLAWRLFEYIQTCEGLISEYEARLYLGLGEEKTRQLIDELVKNQYATTPDVTYNLLFCWPSMATPRDYALLATSKSGTRFYIRTTGAVTEYTGAVSWADANISAMCGSVVAGSSASGAGYSSGDTATGPWRSWTGA